MVDFRGDVCIIPPNSFALARTVEYFRIPRKVLTVCLGKSTYARCGIIVNVTPFEPEWEGYVTLEISNTTPLPAKIYANEGIAQVLFFEGDEECEISYADKKGKIKTTAIVCQALITVITSRDLLYGRKSPFFLEMRYFFLALASAYARTSAIFSTAPSVKERGMSEITCAPWPPPAAPSFVLRLLQSCTDCDRSTMEPKFRCDERSRSRSSKSAPPGRLSSKPHNRFLID